MIKLKYHILYIALLFGGAICFSQERFNLTIDDSLVQVGQTIKVNAQGYEVGYIQPQGNGFKINIYQLDESGNYLQKDSLATYEELNATLFKFKNKYIVSGWKDSSSIISSNEKPYLLFYGQTHDTLWTYHDKTFPSQANYWNPVLSDSGRFLIAGNYVKANGKLDMFISKFDTLGNQIWSKKIDYGIGSSELRNINVTSDGGIILAGGTSSWGSGVGTGQYNNYIKKLDDQGNMEWHHWWTHTEGVLGTAHDYNDSTIIYCGINKSDGINNDVFISKLSLDGSQVWDTTYHLSPFLDSPVDLIVLDNGNYLVFGAYRETQSGDIKGFLIKVNPSNEIVWKRIYSIRNSDQYFRDLIQTSDGGYALTGFVFSDGTPGVTQDVWVVKVDSMGCDVPLCYLGERKLGLELPILKCYPNPTSTFLTIELLENSREIQLYNSAGILQKKLEIENNQKELKLDLSLFPHDIYILRVLDKNDVTIGQGKIVKK
ncbi:MAG: T9SS type A sorting domain-containing protein [Crocinitomicaceae bacterium]|nr:T9SS type A sorting domain-containing protein [Crocinitomicaceae bacterium]